MQKYTIYINNTSSQWFTTVKSMERTPINPQSVIGSIQ